MKREKKLNQTYASLVMLRKKRILSLSVKTYGREERIYIGDDSPTGPT